MSSWWFLYLEIFYASVVASQNFGYDFDVRYWIVFFLLSSFSVSLAFAKDISCYIYNNCGPGSRAGVVSNPSTGNQIRINPSAVPTQKGYGLEGIYFNSDVDFSIVRGIGRIGAALSPSNSDETFFGTPGFEINENLLDRKTEGKKYPNQKINLATAFVLAEKSRSTFNSYALKFGVMGKYNKISKHVNGGAGLSGLLGPITFGVSEYRDESVLDYSLLGSEQEDVIKYKVRTYSVGLSLESLLIDVSKLQYEDPQNSVDDLTSSVRIITVSYNYKKFIFTTSNRLEDSSRLAYNYETEMLETRQKKNSNFHAIQYIANKYITLGVLYNYYLLRDVALTATVFY